MSAHSSKLSEQDAAASGWAAPRSLLVHAGLPAAAGAPQTVEDKDACALYASVRRTAARRTT